MSSLHVVPLSAPHSRPPPVTEEAAPVALDSYWPAQSAVEGCDRGSEEELGDSPSLPVSFTLPLLLPCQVSSSSALALPWRRASNVQQSRAGGQLTPQTGTLTSLPPPSPPLGGTPRCCTPSLHLCSLSLLSNFFSSRSTKLPHLFLSPSAMPTKPTPTNPISAHPVFAGTPCGQNPSLRRRVTNQPRQSPALASLLRSPFGSEVWLVAWKSISRPLVPFFSQSERQKHTSRTRWALQSADGIAESFSSRGGGEGSGNRCKGRASNYSGRSCHIILSWVGVEINKKNVCASSSGSSMLANQYIRVWVLAAKRSASWQVEFSLVKETPRGMNTALAGRLYTVFN